MSTKPREQPDVSPCTMYIFEGPTGLCTANGNLKYVVIQDLSSKKNPYENLKEKVFHKHLDVFEVLNKNLI